MWKNSAIFTMVAEWELRLEMAIDTILADTLGVRVLNTQIDFKVSKSTPKPEPNLAKRKQERKRDMGGQSQGGSDTKHIAPQDVPVPGANVRHAIEDSAPFEEDFFERRRMKSASIDRERAHFSFLFLL
jgi:hypothetical protein